MIKSSFCLNKSNTILVHWEKERKVFENNLLILQRKIRGEAIHELRVAVKKLNAYLQFYSLLQKEKDPLINLNKQLLAKTSELFDITGRQRDVEICLELLTNLQKEFNFSCPQLIRYLKAILKITRTWSANAIQLFKNKELLRVKFLLNQDDQFDNAETLNQKIEFLINTQLTEVFALFRKPHQLRIKLKSIYYGFNLLEENEKYQLEKLNNILDDLGRWQDMKVLLLRIKHFRKDYLPEPFSEFAILKKIESAINLKNKTILRNVRIKIKRWLKLLNGSSKQSANVHE